MKFDFIIGNPPYQTNNSAGTDDGNRSMPIYHLFMDAAYEISDKAMLITPARFLFDAGKTPKEFNQRMLKDKHFKLIKYWPNSSDVFSGVDIKGGVSITYKDNASEFKAIGTMYPYPELFTITESVKKVKGFRPFSELFYPKYSYHFLPKIYDDNPSLVGCLSNEHKYDMESNVFDLMPDAFIDSVPSTHANYACIIGRQNNQRVKKYLPEEYISYPDNYNSYKVMVAISNGSGSFGEVLSTPFVALPKEGNTVTFLSIGKFSNADDANRCLKYIKTKFFRALLGALKITQHNPATVWSLIPIQDFTESSDIDWSKSIHEIDNLLFEKYGLTKKEMEKEKNFIETQVKEMK